MSYFAVIRDAGPAWTEGKGAFEQPGVDDHAAFMDTLADDGIVLFAGPLAGSEHGRIRALLIVDTDSEASIHDRLAGRPVGAGTTARHHQRRAVEPLRRRRADLRRVAPRLRSVRAADGHCSSTSTCGDEEQAPWSLDAVPAIASWAQNGEHEVGHHRADGAQQPVEPEGHWRPGPCADVERPRRWRGVGVVRRVDGSRLEPVDPVAQCCGVVW